MLDVNLDAASLDLWLFEATPTRTLVTLSVESSLAVLQNVVKAHLGILDLGNLCPGFFIGNKEFATVEAKHFQKFAHHVNHANVVDGLGQLNVTEVAGAVSLITSTSLAHLVSLAHSHARIVYCISVCKERHLVVDSVAC